MEQNQTIKTNGNVTESGGAVASSDLLACLKGPWTPDEFVAMLSARQQAWQSYHKSRSDSFPCSKTYDKMGMKKPSLLHRGWLECSILLALSRLLRGVSHMCIGIDSYLCAVMLKANGIYWDKLKIQTQTGLKCFMGDFLHPRALAWQIFFKDILPP